MPNITTNHAITYTNIAPLQDVIRSHCLDSMVYADDAQIYIVIDDPKHSVDSVEVLRDA